MRLRSLVCMNIASRSSRRSTATSSDRGCVRVVDQATSDGWRTAQDEKANVAIKAAITFLQHFQESRIWFDPALCAEIQVVSDTLYRTYVDMTTYDPNDPNTRGERSKMWFESWKRVSSEVPQTRGGTETRVRELLGVIPQGSDAS